MSEPRQPRPDGEDEQLAELRRRAEQTAARSRSLRERMTRDRLSAADQAEMVAEQAEAFGDHLEAAAAGRAEAPG